MKIGCSEVPKPTYPSLLWPAEWKAPAPLSICASLKSPRALPSRRVNLLLTVSSHPKTLDRPPWLGWEDSHSELKEIKIKKIHWLRKRLTMVIEIKTTCDCQCQLQQYSSHLETEPTPFEFWHQFQYFYRSFWIGLLLSKFIGVARRRIYETIKLSFYCLWNPQWWEILKPTWGLCSSCTTVSSPPLLTWPPNIWI